MALEFPHFSFDYVYLCVNILSFYGVSTLFKSATCPVSKKTHSLSTFHVTSALKNFQISNMERDPEGSDKYGNECLL